MRRPGAFCCRRCFVTQGMSNRHGIGNASESPRLCWLFFLPHRYNGDINACPAFSIRLFQEPRYIACAQVLYELKSNIEIKISKRRDKYIHVSGFVPKQVARPRFSSLHRAHTPRFSKKTYARLSCTIKSRSRSLEKDGQPP